MDRYARLNRFARMDRYARTNRFARMDIGHVCQINPLVPEILFCEFFDENLGADGH